MKYKDTIIIPELKACIISSTFVVGHIEKEVNCEHVIKITSISSNRTLDASAYL